MPPQMLVSQPNTISYSQPSSLESTYQMASMSKGIKSPTQVPSMNKRRPPVPPKPHDAPNRFNVHGNLQSQQASPWYKMSGRDDGDGRSMTDSQYSGYSPNNHISNQLQISNHTSKNPTSTPNTSLASQLLYETERLHERSGN